jgi:hypothetical protein
MSDPGHRAELVNVIRQVRNRWRLKLTLRGAVIVVGGTLLALLLSASGLEALKFSAPAIIGFRIAIALVVVALLLRSVVEPLLRRVSDTQVALYLEEHDRSLQTEILSAVEAVETASPDHSPALVDRLVELAVEKCRALETQRAIDRAAMRRHLLTMGGVLAAAALLVVFGPAYLRHGLSALLVLSRSAEAASPYKIEVRPGTATVPRGSDQTVSAKLLGFKSPDAVLMMRVAPASGFERLPLIATADPSTFEGMVFHLEKPIDYYVESAGVRSPIFTITLVDLPAVRQLELEYHFPAYTGLAPQKVESAGDVAALRGTEVRLRVTPTMATPGGRVVLNENSSSPPLTRQADGTLTGSFKIERQGFYRIELDGPHGEHVAASPQYTIDVLGDRPPTVSITKPGRDTSASPVEEVFVDARASDDFGVKGLELVYSMNGGPEKTVKLVNVTGGAKPLPEVSAGHTLYLEELGLKPGDVVSYYARATDNDGVEGPKSATSDIYFVQIRPFRKDYKPAQSQAGGGGGGGNDVGALSRQQREVVAGTFNTLRDKGKVSAEKYRENVVFLTLAQAKVRQQVNELSEKMASRQVNRDPAFQKIAELLPKAAAEMKTAELDLQKQATKEALPPEQRALQILQEAEQEYEVQVSAQRNGGGGGGGGQMAEDLADLFELELDKLANQYEMQQRADQQSTDKKIDELAEKLKELARRQQAEAERQRRLAQAGQNQSGGGSGSSQQRALADEAEQAARRLEQLTREQPRQDLSDAARRLQEAADAMRRAAANASRDGGAAAADAQRRLEEALQQIQRRQGGRGQRDIQNAIRQAEELANDQKEISSEVNGLDQAGAQRDARVQKLAERKDTMEAKLGGLEKDLQQLADDTRGTQRDASRKLQEAASSIRDNKVKEKIRYSKGLLQGQAAEYAKNFEANIGSNLDALRKKIGEAAGEMDKSSKQGQLARALEQTRELVRGMESLDQRMRERAQPGRDGQDRQDGRDGRQGQQGSRGNQQGPPQGSRENQQGSQGQQGQQGSQGSQGSRDAQGLSFGAPRGGNDGSDARPNAYGYGSDYTRQFRRELREYANTADDLRRRLAQAGVNPRDLDAAIRDLRDLENGLVDADPKGLQQLQASVDRLKKFEFDLRKKLGSDSQQLFLSGSDEVPAGFRQAIEEYYRALAKKR